MEYLEGGTAIEYAQIHPERVYFLLYGIARGMKQLHWHGIIHFDPSHPSFSNEPDSKSSAI
jgi:hypothetical protein